MIEKINKLETRNMQLEELLKYHGFHIKNSGIIVKNNTYNSIYNEYKKYNINELRNLLEGYKRDSIYCNEDLLRIAAILAAILKIKRFGNSRVPMAHNIKHYAIDAIALDLKTEALYGSASNTLGKVMFTLYRDIESAIKAYIIDEVDFNEYLAIEDKKKFKIFKEVLPSYLSESNINEIKTLATTIENKIKEIYELSNMSLMNREFSAGELIQEALLLKILKENIIREMKNFNISEETKTDLHYAVIKLIETDYVEKIDERQTDCYERLLAMNTPFAREIAVAIKANEMIAESNHDEWKREVRHMLNKKTETKHSFFDFIEREIPANEKKRALQLAKAILKAWGSQEKLVKGIVNSNLYLAKNKEKVKRTEVMRTLYILEEIIKNNEKQADNYCVPLFYLVYVEVFRKYFFNCF